MGKIPLKVLAQKMGLPEQDLMFKLKSIGVRVEGDNAAIDSDIIQAILKGKPLPQPREVILRDDDSTVPEAPIVAPPPPRQPVARRPGTKRRMIHRVERKIREIPVAEGRQAPVKDEVPAAAAPAATAAAPTTQAAAAKPAAKAAPPAVEKPKAAPPPVAAKVIPPTSTPPAAALKPGAKAVAMPAPKPDAGTAEETAATLSKETAAAGAESPTSGAPKPAAETKPEATKPKKSTRNRARIIELPSQAPPAKPSAPQGPPRPRQPMQPPPSPSRGRRRRNVQRMDDRRHTGRKVSGNRRPAEVVPPKAASSARGKRRVQKRQETGEQPQSTIQFKDERPSGPVTINQHMTVREFADKLGIKVKDLIKALFDQGLMVTINHVLDIETATQVAENLGVDVMEVTIEEEVQLLHEIEQEDSGKTERKKLGRAPIVTVMGHVDHGKTTLLDAIRQTNVVDGEAGGITQHIGAYHVDVGENKIVFLDTPGHEAFTMMRARGAKVTDIVILVVAADDGVMPQTAEAIDHAKAAGVPILVAINKVDKANANLDKVKKELADNNLLVEDWGGDVVSVPISALKREGISELLDMVTITAEILELKATPELPGQGVVLEARKEIGRGIIATLLVQDGSLQRGDVFVAGSTWGRVRSMSDDLGESLDICGPASPVEVTGFNELPSAGDLFQVFTDEAKAREVATHRSHEDRRRDLAPKPAKVSLDQLFEMINEEEIKELPVIIKADVQGSVEVLKDSLEKLSTDKVKINVIQSGVGAISTNNVILASASNAIIIGFNVRPERNATTLAEKEQVEIRFHTVIYELIDELRAAMAGLLEPTFKEVHAGRAEVRQTFKVPKIGVVAGSYIIDGTIPRSAGVRLLRDNVVVYEGKISSLRRFKEDVSEVRTGFECGIGLENYQDLKPGDIIEAFIREEVAATL